MTRILVIDDEASLVELVRSYLEREQYEVLTAGDGSTALDLARSTQPDLVVLDVMLPELDGIEVCRQLRQFSEAYVIMLTARAEEIDKILGLTVGADDYLTKPFSPRELVARIKALLRRPRQTASGLQSHAEPLDDAPAPQHWDDLTIDEAQHEVTLHGQPVELTAREFALLLALAQHPGRVFTRAQLLERVWGDAYYDDHVVDVHIGNLRKKLEADAAHPQYLETVREWATASGAGGSNAMRRPISFRASLGGKFLLSYLLIVLVGVATLLLVTFALAPTLFQAQLLPILQTHPNSLTTTEASQRILGDFLGTLFVALAVAAIAATVTSLAISLFVARRITGPLQQMTQVSERISAGHYAERIEIAPVHATDELGKLAASINALAVALEETERRRLEVIGNVTHELRTPIATLEGYLEGLLDGVIELTPRTFAMLHTEAGRLRRLVQDLQELSRAEARQIPLSLQSVASQSLVQEALEPLKGQFAEKGLQLQVNLPEDLPQVLADPFSCRADPYKPAGQCATLYASARTCGGDRELRSRYDCLLGQRYRYRPLPGAARSHL